MPAKKSLPSKLAALTAADQEALVRTLTTTLINRSQFAQRVGTTFGGKREVAKALGYLTEITPADYRARFKRNGVAARVVEAMPKATWRGGAEVIDDDDPETETTFETAFEDLATRTSFWSVFQRADVLAGLGRYSAVLIGAPGQMETELPTLKGPDSVLYLAPYGEEEMTIHEWVTDPEDERYGLPAMYQLKRRTAFIERNSASLDPRSPGITDQTRLVHWTRVIHVTDNLLDDRVFGLPRMERVWNLLDDLEKVTGGGAEAFWQRAHQGLQLDVDPEMPIKPADVEDLKTEVQNYIHGFSRTIRTRGVKVNPLGADTADFSSDADTILTQISTATGIPRRILEGSEQGELASSQDRSNWNERVQDRRRDVCEPHVRAFVDRLIEYKGLPTPKDGEYEVTWPREEELTLGERVALVNTLATANATHIAAAGEPLVLGREIRDALLNWEPIDDVMEPGETGMAPKPTLMDPSTGQTIEQPPGTPPIQLIPPSKPPAAPKPAAKRAARRRTINVTALTAALDAGDEDQVRSLLDDVLAS